MGWSDIISRVQSFLPTEKIAQVTQWINKARTAYDEGAATVEDIIDLGVFLNDQFQLLQQTNSQQLKTVIESVLNNTYQNKYTTLVTSMSFDEMMAMQSLSTAEMVKLNNAKVNQLEAIRTIAALPGRIQSLVAMVF